MIPKPKHLGPEYAEQFGDGSVVAAYKHRPPYPPEVFDVLVDLITDTPRTVLDVGCGTGNLARLLAERVERVDAVDLSPLMIETGKRMPGGDHPRLRWFQGRAETVPLYPPYALIVAGASLHWMDWYVALPRFRGMLSPHGYFAITGDGWVPVPWWTDAVPIISRYSTNRDYQPYDLLAELERRGIFQKLGEKTTAPVPFRQSVDEYIESFHARNGLSRDRMAEENAVAFDRELRELVTPFAKDGQIELQIVCTVTWGRPVAQA